MCLLLNAKFPERNKLTFNCDSALKLAMIIVIFSRRYHLRAQHMCGRARHPVCQNSASSSEKMIVNGLLCMVGICTLVLPFFCCVCFLFSPSSWNLHLQHVVLSMAGAQLNSHCQSQSLQRLAVTHSPLSVFGFIYFMIVFVFLYNASN